MIILLSNTELRIIFYALHLLLANIDCDTEDDLGLTEKEITTTVNDIINRNTE